MGYNHKQPILLSKITSKLSKFSVDVHHFEIEKEVLARQLRNFKAEQPHTHAKYFLSVLTDNMAWTKEELGTAIEGMSAVKPCYSTPLKTISSIKYSTYL